MIPPEDNAEFVACMEEVLDIYERPYNPNIPVVCMDEQPIQITKEVRAPIKATRNHPKRVDYEYERAGTASIFIFTEPLAGWRSVKARDHRTKVDWALEVAELLDTRYAHCEQVIDRRFGDLATLCEAIGDWSQDINSTQKGVDWQMKIDDARAKLKSVYPRIES